MGDELHRRYYSSPGGRALVWKTAETGDSVWLHSRGMRKFARPDISIAGIPESGEGPALEIIHRFIEFQALGSVVAEGGRLPPCHPVA